ncbi:Gamma-tubulin complex component 4 [Gryganskiella cystojenkinii]|nr:Gamma-tubulin complex component 4 [Gryganskiella cystojenkinii]
MLHELLLCLSGYPGDIFQPFPLEPATATTFAITNFPLLHPAEKEGLDRLAQLGFHYRNFRDFITSCRSSGIPPPPTSGRAAPTSLRPSLYLKAIGLALEQRLNTYRKVILETEVAILSGEDNLGGMVPLSTISARFAPYQLIFPAVAQLLKEIQDASVTETPYIGGRLLDLLRDKAASGVPIQREWMNELLKSCYGIMMRQVVSWVIYGQIQDPFQEFFILQNSTPSPSSSSTSTSPPGPGQKDTSSRDSRRNLSSSNMLRSRTTHASSTLSNGATKWQSEYGLDESMLPKFIPLSLAEAMLFIGKSIATAREAKPKPVPIPQSMTLRHQSLLLPLIPTSSTAMTTSESRSSTLRPSQADEATLLDLTQLTSVIFQIRRDIANHLWVVVQVGDKVVETLESFRRYFLLCDGEFGLGMIRSLDEFKRNRLSRLNQLVNLTSNAPQGVRDHDLGGMLIKAAQGTPAQEDPALRRFELHLVKTAATTSTFNPSELTSALGLDPGTAAIGQGSTTGGMFDDQLLGIPVRMQYTLAWPLDFFLTSEDLTHYADVFAFLLTVRKAQVKLQQAWIDIKSMTQQVVARRRGRGSRAYSSRIHGTTTMTEEKEEDVMDVIGPTYDTLLKSITTHEATRSSSSRPKSRQDNSNNNSDAMELDSSFIANVEPINNNGDTTTKPDKETSEASSKSFDSIYSLHAEALHEIRRACLLTSTPLCESLKNILVGTEMFSGIVSRRATGQDGFRSGLSDDQDERMWQDWMDISQLNQTFRENTAKLFADLSAVSKSGTLSDGPVLNRSGVFGSSILGTGTRSFEVIRQLDQLLLRLEFSKSMWFSSGL